jgi:hypothetical protein
MPKKAKDRSPKRRRARSGNAGAAAPGAVAPTRLLMLSLEAAVPLWVERHRATAPEQRAERASALGSIVAYRGDHILFRTGRPGQTAEAFNALAEGIALLSFQPGGVKFTGRHWESTPRSPRRN